MEWKKNDWFNKDPDMGVFCEKATRTATYKISQETHTMHSTFG